MKKYPKYIRCDTCGKWIVLSEETKDGKCSHECRGKWKQCFNCGKYFPAYINNDYCSSKCEERFDHRVVIPF